MTGLDDPHPPRLTLEDPTGLDTRRVPPILDRALQDLQDVGLSPSLVERFVSWWKRYGLRQASIFVIAVTLPLWRYVWIPTAVSGGLATFAENYGADLSVDDWSSNWFDIEVTGEKVTLAATGPYTEQQILRAEAIEIDWSLFRALGNVTDRLRALVFLRPMPPEEPFHSIRLHRATLHVERLLSGRWNWQDAIQPERIDIANDSRYRLPMLDADQLRLVWVEHLPSDSGGGLIEQKTASLFLDDVKLRFSDLVLPEDGRGNATRFVIEGRTGDGRFSATGETNLGRWNSPPLNPGASKVIFQVPSPPTSGWSPTFSVSLYLENVGAAAFARMVSDASLLPSAGTMTGRINFVVTPEGVMNCEIDLQLRNIQYAANPRSNYVRARRTEVERGIKELQVSDHIAKKCSAPWNDPGIRLAKVVQAEITGEAVQDASPAVQAAAGYDRLRFVQTDKAAIDRYTSDMTAKIGEALGGKRGAAVARALMADEAGNGNPMTRGLRNVGRGVRRLFGGGGDDKKRKDPK